MEFFKTSHAMLLICLGHLYLYVMLAQSLTNKNLDNHVPLVHHTYSCFYLNESL